MPSDKAYIFDFNGTLFWDTEYNLEAWNSISLRYRGTLYTQEERLQYNGRNSMDTARFFLKGQNQTLDHLKAVVTEKELLYQDMCLKTTPTLAPGAVDLITNLYKQGSKIAIATGAPKINVDAYRKWFPILSLFGSNIVLDDNPKRKGKPEPDIYLETMEMLGVDPPECVVFEDSKAGVISAERAGIAEVWVLQSPLSSREASAVPGISGTLADFTSFRA